MRTVKWEVRPERYTIREFIVRERVTGETGGYKQSREPTIAKFTEGGYGES